MFSRTPIKQTPKVYFVDEAYVAIYVMCTLIYILEKVGEGS